LVFDLVVCTPLPFITLPSQPKLQKYPGKGGGVGCDGINNDDRERQGQQDTTTVDEIVREN
jgi:hypothetical protein